MIQDKLRFFASGANGLVQRCSTTRRNAELNGPVHALVSFPSIQEKKVITVPSNGIHALQSNNTQLRKEIKKTNLPLPMTPSSDSSRGEQSPSRKILLCQLLTLKWGVRRGVSWLHPFQSVRCTACTWAPWISHTFSPGDQPLVQAVTWQFHCTLHLNWWALGRYLTDDVPPGII